MCYLEGYDRVESYFKESYMRRQYFCVIILLAIAMPPLSALLAEDASIPDSAADVSPLDIGKTVPSVQVKTIDGKPVSIHKALNKKNTLLIFYRGGWCPYCNVHLAKLATVQDTLQNYHIQILGVSPDRPERLKRTTDKQSLHYTLLSDSKMNLARAFGLAFRVDDETFTRYKNQYDIDLEANSGEDHHLLPVPAAYLIDTSGTIRFRYYHENYKKRIPIPNLLEAAKQLYKGTK